MKFKIREKTPKGVIDFGSEEEWQKAIKPEREKKLESLIKELATVLEHMVYIAKASMPQKWIEESYLYFKEAKEILEKVKDEV